MHHWIRPAEPRELAEARPALTQKWKDDRKSSASTAKLSWPKVLDDSGCEETLQQRFHRLTRNHCAYCDTHVAPASKSTIDHFHPKSEELFYDEVYLWENLYHCCWECQAKGTVWDDDVLRPDELDSDGQRYTFHRYFRYERNGELTVIATEETDSRRAGRTIEVLKLNRERLREHRALEFATNLIPRQRPLTKVYDPATAARMMARRERFDVTDLRYRDWYLQTSGTTCCCEACEAARIP